MHFNDEMDFNKFSLISFSPAYLYYPKMNQCFPAYRQGPCGKSEYLILPKSSTTPKCAPNPCLWDTFVVFEDACHELNEAGPCPYPELGQVLGINETTLEISCVQNL